MRRKKEFTTLAHGLLSSFVSRNNDVSGYWGIGKFYSHMLSSQSMILNLDFITKTLEPENKEFQKLINQYARKLFTQMEKRGLDTRSLRSAKLILEGFPNEPSPHLQDIAPNRMFCQLILSDDLGKEYRSETNIWCRVHSPDSESRSARG